MTSSNENQLRFIDQDGKERFMEILFTFDSEDFGKSYVFFCDPDALEKGEDVSVFCASYTPVGDDEFGALEQITDEDEWDMISEVLEAFAEGEFD